MAYPTLIAGATHTVPHPDGRRVGAVSPAARASVPLANSSGDPD
ncbi:MAG: hypothetical protein V3U35_03890 [Candidatus Neomarinimicrobiota bacterium]